MKKWLCVVLTCAMCFTSLMGNASVAFAWEDEVVSEQSEPEVGLADDAGDTGLTIVLPDEATDELDLTFPESAPEEEAAETEAETTSLEGAGFDSAADVIVPYYARVLESVPLDEGFELLKDDVVLVTGATGDGLVRYALHTPAGTLEGDLSAEALEVLTGEDLSEYLIALSQREGLVLYEDRIDYPLPEKDIAAADDVSVEEKAAQLIVNVSNITIGAGETYKGLQSEAFDSSEALPDVIWTSRDEKTVKVTNAEKGYIKGVKAGSTTLDVVTADGSAQASVKVTVAAKPTKIKVSPTSKTIVEGESFQISADVNSGAASGAIKYTSSKPAVAEVDQDGIVTGISKNAKKITINASTYNGKKATCTVVVLGKPQRVEIEESEYISIIGMSDRIEAQVLDADGEETCGDLTYVIDDASADPGCIELNAETGAFTALRKGRALVRAILNDELYDVCEVHVMVGPEDMQLNASKLTMGLKETYSGLEAILTPPEGEMECASGIKWSSSDPKIVKVDSETGELTGKKLGKATVYAKTQNNIKRSVSVTVENAPKKLALEPSALVLGTGSTDELSVSFPKKTASAYLRFESGDSDVADVDEYGLVTGVSRGETVIRAYAFNEKYAECKVTVLGVPHTIELSDDQLEMGSGTRRTLSAEVLDDEGELTFGDLIWTVSEAESDDPSCISVDQDGVVTALKRGSAVVTVSCGDITASCNVDVYPGPVALTLNRSELDIGLKETYEGLEAELTPPEGEEECRAKITWSSLKEKIATVDPDTGAVKGVKAGTTTIIAETDNGLSRSVTVRVMKQPTKLTLDISEPDLSRNETAQLTAAVKKNTASATIVYDTSDEAVVTVDENGTVTAVGKGDAELTATTYSGVSTSCSVHVYGDPVTVVPDQEVVRVLADTAKKITVSGVDADGDYTPVKPTFAIDNASADPECIRLDSQTGSVTGVSKGEATVCITDENGAEGTCIVKVVPAPADLVFENDEITIGVKEVYGGLQPTLIPPEGEDDCDTVLRWYSRNSTVAQVDLSTGVVTGKKAGTATIVVETHNGIEKSVTVNVAKTPSSVKLEPRTLEVGEGMTVQLNPVTNVGAGCGNYSFDSSDEAVAVVDDNGLVTGISKGVSTLTVKTFNGKSATCKVTVLSAPASIEFGDGDMTLMEGESRSIKTTIYDEYGDVTKAALTFEVDAASANADCIQVDASNGEITALKMGTAVVTASAGNDVKAQMNVTVVEGPVRAEFAKVAYEIEGGERLTVIPVFYGGSGKVLKDITYTLLISGTSVRKDGDNAVIGVKRGTSVITAVAPNGIAATCTVTVNVRGRYRFYGVYDFYYNKKVSNSLYFPKNNANSVWSALSKSNIGGMQYEKLGILGNSGSRKSILNGIKNAFSDSDDNDVNVIYICSHGYNKIGSKTGKYNVQLPGLTKDYADSDLYISASDLFKVIQPIRGRIVLVLDSCFSGVFISNMRSSLDAEDGRISVLTAAGNTKACYYTIKDTDSAYDYFTYGLLYGLGYEMSDSHSFDHGMSADTDGDGAVTLNEFFNYGYKKALKMINSDGGTSRLHGDTSQTPQYYEGDNGDLVIFQK